MVDGGFVSAFEPVGTMGCMLDATIAPCFTSILGQHAAVETLTKAVQGDRLHHAWIFYGPKGVGKLTTAMAFGKWLLETDPHAKVVVGAASDDGDGGLGFDTEGGDGGSGSEEDDDEAILRTGHPDLHVVTKELARYSQDAAIRNRKLTSIPVEVLRESLIEPVYRAANVGQRKVFIVDEAELLNETGQNALLKTLEEPPEGTVLVLVTSSEDRLLPTIRSRCQRVGFTPLLDAVVRDWVMQQIQSKGLELSDKLRDWVVSFASGSLGRAHLALSWGLTEWAQAVLPKVELAARGRPDGELGAIMAGLIDVFAKAWVDAHKNASKEAANKMASDLMWVMLTQHARKRLLQLSEQTQPGDLAGGDQLLEPWLGLIDAVEHAKTMLASHVNLGMVCDFVGVSIAAVFADER